MIYGLNSLFCGTDDEGLDLADFMGGRAKFKKLLLDKVGDFAAKVYRKYYDYYIRTKNLPISQSIR